MPECLDARIEEAVVLAVVLQAKVYVGGRIRGAEVRNLINIGTGTGIDIVGIDEIGGSTINSIGSCFRHLIVLRVATSSVCSSRIFGEHTNSSSSSTCIGTRTAPALIAK